MHPLYEKAHELTESVIGAAIEVHRDKGPGLLESIYEWCLTCEFDFRSLAYKTQDRVTIHYKGRTKVEELKFDLLVENCLLVEAKAVQQILPIHKAQLMSYMKLLNIPIGLLFNFHDLKLIDGMHRLILPGCNLP